MSSSSSSSASSVATTTTKPARRKYSQRAKKPSDMPRRPHCAYNVFFKAEKDRWLAAHARGQIEDGSRGSRFIAMTRAICRSWKTLSAADRRPYQQAAARDRERYAAEMKVYRAAQQQHQDQSVRSELNQAALATPPSASSASSAKTATKSDSAALDDPQAPKHPQQQEEQENSINSNNINNKLSFESILQASSKGLQEQQHRQYQALLQAALRQQQQRQQLLMMQLLMSQRPSSSPLVPNLHRTIIDSHVATGGHLVEALVHSLLGQSR